MNSQLDILDSKVEELITIVETNLLENWGHKDYSNFILDSIKLMRQDIHYFDEYQERFSKYTREEEIVHKIMVVLPDTRNMLLINDKNLEIINFINKYITLINNWNSILHVERLDYEIKVTNKLLTLIK